MLRGGETLLLERWRCKAPRPEGSNLPTPTTGPGRTIADTGGQSRVPERMHIKRLAPQMLNGESGYNDPSRPDRGWIRVLTELELRIALVRIAKKRNVSLSSIVREALWAYLGTTVWKGEGMVRFNGAKNPARRQRVEKGLPLDDVFPLVLPEYRKTSTIYAVAMPVAFEVDTPEGLMQGKVGDYLAVGVGGEMYPIDGAIFAVTYERVEA